MIERVSAHRQANAFALLLETPLLEEQGLEEQTLDPEAATSRSTGIRGAEVAEAGDAGAAPDRMLALAGALSRIPQPSLDPDVKTVQRAQLVAAMQAAFADEGSESRYGRGFKPRAGRRPAPLGDLWPKSRWGRRLAAGGVALGIMVAGFGGATAVSRDALPGDTLYGLKRSVEDLRLNFADGSADKGKVYLDLATTRIKETSRLVDRAKGGEFDDKSVAEIRKALSNMRQEASEGHRLLSDEYRDSGSLKNIQALSDFSSANAEAWAELRDKLPVQVRELGDDVSSVLDEIAREVAPLRALLPPSSQQNRTGGLAAGSGPSDTGVGGETGSAGATPSSPDASGTPAEGGTESGSPSSSATGSAGSTGDAGSTATTSPSGGQNSPTDPNQDPGNLIELPPLLPGLLPALTLDWLLGDGNNS